MHGSCYRANVLTRSIITMLTKHRLENYCLQVVRVLLVAYKIAVNTQPVHIVEAQHFTFTYHGYIVFYVASHHASMTTDTKVHIDRHTPFEARLKMVSIQGSFLAIVATPWRIVFM